jgi:cation diffusion facilitator family transporter
MGYSRHSQGVDHARVREIKFVLWLVLGLNVAVAVAKLLYGLWIDSVAMQADGFHSFFDGASNVVGLVGMAVAAQPADHDHPYGHGKYETYSSAAIGAMLLGAAWKVGSAAAARLGHAGLPPRVDAGSFAVMIGTLVVNLFVTAYERRRGKALRSEILVADANHTGSDILVSLGVIASLWAVRLGYPLFDPIIALLVAAAIVRTAWQVFRQASDTLSDRARIPVQEVCAAAMKVPGVLGCHAIRTRGAESDVYVDLHIQVDPKATVEEGHAVAETVEKVVCESFEQVADVIVHLEPLDEYQASKTAELFENVPP